MKRFTIFILSLFFSYGSNANTHKKIEDFALFLIKTVKSSDVSEFQKVGCVKIHCGEIGIEYIFGENESSKKFNMIMSKEDVTYRIFGPYTVEPEYPGATYSIIFYSPSKSPFDAAGEISMEVGSNELYKSFLQTQVTVVDGEVLFQRVPFYLESHHPYIGDYG